MARQPLLYVRRNAQVRFPANALKERPELAILMAECIAVWSIIEVEMATMLAAIMKAHAKPSAAVFLSIRNARAQREAITAAAEIELTGRDLEMFQAIMIVYQALEAQRSDLAHGVFGVTVEIPDSVVWVEARDYTSERVQNYSDILNNRLPQADDSLREKCFVYRKADLETLRDEITELWHAAFLFTICLQMPFGGEIIEREFQKLYTLPQIQRALSRLRDC